jgi:tRNA-specific 2-thiouridylase
MPSQGTEAAAGDAVTRVCAIALSGGVDSSYAAHLLRDRFETLVGVSHAIWKDSRCCNVETIAKARGLCAEIGIRIFSSTWRRTSGGSWSTISSRLWQRKNAEPLREVQREASLHDLPSGGEGSPRVRGDPFRWRGVHVFHRTLRPYRMGGREGRPSQGIDLDKDQSYMLYRVPQRILERTVFPLGTMRKRDVLREFGQGGLRLPVAPPPAEVPCERRRRLIRPRPVKWPRRQAAPRSGPRQEPRPDNAGSRGRRSQEPVSWTPTIPIFSPVTSRDRGFTPGDIVDSGGAVIGTHRGFIHYTIGQRKGLGLGSGPWFVLRIEPRRTVSSSEGRKSLAKAPFRRGAGVVHRTGGADVLHRPGQIPGP